MLKFSAAKKTGGNGAASALPDRDGGTESSAPSAPRIAIIGVPNCGKSLLFNRLTGAFASCCNYPYTTTELEEKSFELNGREYTFIDTPAISGLELAAEEEAPTVAMLTTNPPDIIVQCMDAGNLHRSLLLAAELAELEIPTVVCLNMVDEAASRGIYVDPDRLSEQLGVPVSSICALDGRGVNKLASNLERARYLRQASYPDCLQRRLEHAEFGGNRAQQLAALLTRRRVELEPGQNLHRMAFESHRHWAENIVAQTIRQIGIEPAQTHWDALGRFALHPVGAWVALFSIIPVVYFLVAELGAGILAGPLDEWLVAPAIDFIASLTGPGVVNEILVGDYGLLSLGLFNALGTVVPILTVFYLFFGLLEDVGYFPLLSVQFDRLLRFIGLNGKAVLPVTLGFGCSAVATLAIRCLESRRERYIAAFLISLGIPCAAQLAIIAVILAAFPLSAVLGVISIVVLIQVLAGIALARLLPDRKQTDFLVEIPRLRAPQWTNVASKTYHRLVEFTLEAVPLFMASAALLLTLKFAGLLDRIRDFFAPVVVGALGLPEVFADALLVTLARRELVALMFSDIIASESLTLQQTFIGLLVIILFIPCMTTIMTIGRTLGWRGAASVSVSVAGIAIAVGAIVNLIWI